MEGQSLSKQLIVIGGGAAGMMAALSAAAKGVSVTLLERNPKLGRKLYITGKGRCNVTNDCTAEEALACIPCNSRFLFSAMSRFTPKEVISYFEGLGVPLKTERGNRVFPVSDKAADIIDALLFALRRAGVRIVEDRAVEVLTQEEKIVGVRGEKAEYKCEVVILATGGVSYPLTGSTGDGYEFAQQFGHTIVTPKASLVALTSDDPDCPAMQGLSLRNVAIKVKGKKGKAVYAEQGEMLFTHFGLSGPLILSASAHMRNYEKENYTVVIDLKPALDESKLDARLLREISDAPNRDFGNLLGELVPRLMIPVLVRRTGIPSDTKAHSITKQQRRCLLETLKAFTVEISGTRPVAEAIITSGGVKVGEVDPHSMASKKQPGLYFAGEMLDVDAYTGGFNLQIAWCTGKAAGEGAADYLLELI